ncbi:MAG: hypothetical protein ABJN18_09640, partial [Marinobacter sp.]|uniref:hypothetical protein n=1 Tax=Marinobacter sp. TaxID=50741 RepID=UPI003297277D
IGLFSGGGAFAETKVLINKDIPTRDLDTSYLNQIFAMQTRRWPNGAPIHVFVLPSTDPRHREFVVNHLKSQAHQMDRIWNRMLFTGTGKPPTVVSSERDMYVKILNTPGAIGYVSADYPVEDVHVLGEKEK